MLISSEGTTLALLESTVLEFDQYLVLYISIAISTSNSLAIPKELEN
jgi:hypothetical protein